MTDAERLLTVKDVAARFKVTGYTVRKWIRQGKLQASMPGGTRTGWRITEASVSELLEQTKLRTPKDIDEKAS